MLGKSNLILLGFLILSLCFSATQLLAQTDNTLSFDLQWLIERQAELEGENFDLETYKLMLDNLKRTPLPINKIGFENLDQLPFLQEAEKLAIWNHLQQYGKLNSIFELQAIQGITLPMAQILSNFVSVSEPELLSEPFSHWLKKGKQELILQAEMPWQKAKAYQLSDGQKYYLGDRSRTVMRYRFSYKNRLYAGFSAEKDAGEAYGKASFLSMHLCYNGNGLIRNISFGDFQASFGKGLTLASRAPMGKGSQVFQTRARLAGLMPFRSVTEYGFLRGIGVSLGKGKFNLSALASSLPITTGLHRTLGAYQKKLALRQELLGLNLSYSQRNYTLGFLVQGNRKSNTYASGIPLNKFFGGYGAGIIKNWQWSAELSKGLNQNYSFIAEIIRPLHSKLDWLVLFRSYPGLNQNAYAAGWSEFFGTSNEQGIYTAFILRPSKKIQMSFYQDVFWAPQARFQKILGGQGQEWLFDMQYKFSKTLMAEVRYRHRNAQLDHKLESNLLNQSTTYKQQVRLQLSWQSTEKVLFRLRYEEVNWNNLANGSAAFVEGVWTSKANKITLSGRYTQFFSEHEETRIYAIERDVPLQYSLNSFSGLGSNTYLLLRYIVKKGLDVHFKIGHLVQTDGSRPGSAWDEIEESQLTEFRLQIRYLW
jgi:hypothetical protein